MKKRIVISLGHKDLGTNLPEQKKAISKTAKLIADLIEDGYQIALTHSNAPQVGMIHTAMNEFGKQHNGYTNAPMSVCSAMSQGYIGYDLQNGIRSELLKRGILKSVSTILTQVRVDPYDEAFYTPTKKVGRFMSAAEAQIEDEKGNFTVEVDGKGYQRIFASPKPKEIIEIDAIRALLDADQIVIACGGGGIPVMAQGYNLRGASAVIEKDLVGGLLAKEVNADIFIILTAVDAVSIKFNKPNEETILQMNIDNARKYIDANEFEFASMLPKVEASIDFVLSGENKKSYITSLEKCEDALRGVAGTVITK
ncbi:carbamate kinase [Lachnoanaerobaculum umeaense]|jgi:hypothetical protein|uniref:Carbamate kinase n=1 Tax=Lachnoanaerobaculum umeaense TaxID=617123 RepID=A0A385Q1V3_9FIRM|nr:carbamate kinase [Lachnoanaerobaculum umeaense]AYB00372.1 carbamate kinase [Lachnoanaerobaculum umeaense]PZW99865.1 carbamate kinase [Lachnoanaerobaculum umeaense]